MLCKACDPGYHRDQGGLTVRNEIMGPPDFHTIGFVISSAFDKLTVHSCGMNSRVNIQACSEILKLCTDISSLDLSANRFSDEGVKMVASRLKWFKSLFYLNLTENILTQEGAAALADGLRCCTSIESGNCNERWWCSDYL